MWKPTPRSFRRNRRPWSLAALLLLLSLGGGFWLWKLESAATKATLKLSPSHSTQPSDSTTPHANDLTEIMLLLDFSRSMRAMDFKIEGELVGRVDALKHVTKHFIEGHPKHRIGIVAFAGAPYVVGSPTLDHASLLAKLALAKPENLGRDGTAIGSAICAGCVQLETGGERRRLLVLITDGDNNAGFISPITAAEYAAMQHLGLLVVSIGTSGFAPVPIGLANGKTAYHNIKFSANEESLKQIAGAAHGQFRAAIDFEKLVEIFGEIDTLEVERSAGSLTPLLPNRFYESFGQVTLKDNALQLEEPATPKNSAPASTPQVAPPSAATPPKPISTDKESIGAFAELLLGKSTLAVGEPVSAQIRMYVPSEIRWQPQAMPVFLPEGFIAERLPEPTSAKLQLEERDYDLLHFETTLTPLRAGRVTIRPVTIKYVALLPRARSTDPGSKSAETIARERAIFSTTAKLSVSTAAVEVNVEQ